MLACPEPLYPGARPRVLVQLGSVTLEAQFDVRHASTEWDTHIGGYRVGGRFTWISPAGRLAMEQFQGGSRR
jgi:hypothetical protein